VETAGYAGLFAAAFGEATFLPIRSEIVLVGLLFGGTFDIATLLIVASIANTLGAIVNWALGYFLATLEDRPWYPIRREKMARAEAWYRKWGRWSLLLSWLPVIGDLLTVAAGMLREPLPVFVALVGIAKTVRYATVIALALNWI
jgi:membrane protein YqaA with SNARE-associated domain